MADYTTINISKELWKCLNGMKECGESFDQLIRRVLKVDIEVDKEGVNA